MRSVPACNLADLAGAARFRDMSLSQLVERGMQAAGRTAVERLYVGSNFCNRLFLNQPERLWREAFDICRREGIPATLVVPVFPQADLAAGRARIAALLHRYGRVIDEITVNDVGMLSFCLERFGRPLNLGRLLSKMPRDPRYAKLFAERLVVDVPTLVSELFHDGEVQGVELDPTHAALDLSRLVAFAPELSVGVHMPYCYLSTGFICESAGIGRRRCGKFRPNATCSLECSRLCTVCRLPAGASVLTWGRTVFFPNYDCRVSEGEDFRMIVSPFDVLLERDIDGSSSGGAARMVQRVRRAHLTTAEGAIR